ncbi:nucleoside-diphosphate-sugar epimerase [Antricoccus suffuscus]|uniref:Nucleoside-diphosphate-sugar epimerase n=1 Tax=Antricoccus suffuscus TaxID=1629062 RepID=A0A2T0ZXR9_9ACTN|nr:NAD(P)-dependent oxidoreductase [Antricoccus suffuscus]PRZ41151.1 nucleoside-diphosphate-sugar epimerase [Antricoccus suffuscus]
MRILLAGATGAIGHSLTPALVEAGHTVFGTTRTESHTGAITAAGASPVLMDGLDRGSVMTAVAEAKPDVVLHQLTSLKAGMNPKHFDRDFAMTNRLRTEATDYLLEASRQNGVTRFIAQSYAGWPAPRTGPAIADETAGYDPHVGREARASLAAIRHVEAAVLAATDLEAIALRYGGFYGPGTGIALDEESEMLEMVRQRKFPIVGSGGGLWSFIHAIDAAAATVTAVDNGAPGIYNIVDDEPASAADWLPVLSRTLGAKPPRHVPTWLAKPLLGEQGVNMMTTVRGASNAKAKRELGWTLRYPSWRIGFTEGL